MSPADLINKFPPVLHWIKETSSFHTRLHVHNYFSFLFPASDMNAQIVVSIYDENGGHLRDHSTILGKDQSKFIEFNSLLEEVSATSLQGSVTVQIVPDKQVDIFSKYEVMGSEFYMSYYSNDGGFSIVHNARSVRYLPSRPLRSVMRILVDSSYDTSIVFQNVFYGSFLRSLQTLKPEIIILNEEGAYRKLRGPSIPPRGCREVRLLDLDATLGDFLGGQPGAAYLSGKNMYFKPLTLITHLPSNTFSVHHT